MNGKPPALASMLMALINIIFVVSTEAGPVTTFDLDFKADSQSMWGPGGSALDFRSRDSFGSSLGFRYDAQASTGSVSANYNGVLKATADYYRNPNKVTLDFRGDVNGGMLDTFLGASLTADAFVDFIVTGSVNLIDQDYSLDIERGFTPALGSNVSGSDNANLVEPGVDFLGLAYAAIQVGIDQTANLNATGISGNLVQTHRSSGKRVSEAFTLGGESLELDLSIPYDPSRPFRYDGYWDISFEDLVLNNVFSTTFDLAFDALVGIDLPFLDPIEWNPDLFGFPFYTSRFGLEFNEIAATSSFAVYVPEPNMLGLFGLSTGILLLLRRRHSQSGARHEAERADSAHY